MTRIAYTVDEVVELLGVGRTTLYEAIKAGDLQTKKLGRRTLILAEELDRWVDSLPASSAR